MRYQLHNAFVVAAELETVWTFFSTAENLPKITPPWMHFRIDTPQPIRLQKNSIIDYTIRWASVPLHWKTRIINWEPPNRFIDLQEKGPYKLWHHEHTFERTADGVRCGDCVTYEIPMGPLGQLMHAAMIRRQLIGIFSYRRIVIERELGPVRPIDGGLFIRRM